jgi:DNA invertase Pin-like site-specific DNA recombinase
MADILGYARVSTTDKDLDGQRYRFTAAGAIRIFDDMISGRKVGRPGLPALLDYDRAGDVLCVLRLDRLGRSTLFCVIAEKGAP